MAEQSAQVEHLNTRNRKRNENDLNDRTAIADEPKKLFAIEGLFPEARSSRCGDGRTEIDLGEVATETALCAPHAEPHGAGDSGGSD